ncbi:mechanosensitive ion channel family protein [Algoriphagus pacificus]|uniref:Mechanosensitive ion channel family protein n=1 Tax=Algoriphagus pacificus TaxID=2811234 RepID=A0ABS3CAW9_9BACT|nr:mechanosensitive ion channel family protein [Algoriphagus pacificus]MBN7814157.1 mechanosensitive ion channel family protein [Algoriphagus pacificus]
MELSQETISAIWEQAIELAGKVVPSLIYALLFYIVGKFLINKLIRGFRRLLEKRDDNPSLNEFLIGLVKALLYVSLGVGIANILGVPVTSFVAILGAAGLAIGLALQGSLSNFAGGVLILLFKPFKVGDVITAQGHTGSVVRIDILYTHMTTFDKKEIIIPNGALANSDVVNMSTQPVRRADFSVGVAYSSDLKKVREIVLEVFKNDERVHQDPAPVVFLNGFGDSSLDLIIRVWTDAETLWPVYFDGMEAIKEAFEKNDISIPFPQREVRALTD